MQLGIVESNAILRSYQRIWWEHVRKAWSIGRLNIDTKRKKKCIELCRGRGVINLKRWDLDDSLSNDLLGKIGKENVFKTHVPNKVDFV